jgi:TolB-like protein/DNA-binding winged helix-turn-helix (wHTH) protein/Flp pilus assembly protein TadD
MTPSSLSPRAIRFGVFEADLSSGELRKSGVRVKLHAQPFQVLSVLLQHPGELVTRQQLSKELWAEDTFVDSEQGLATAISKIREALGDSADNPRYVETLPRRGYRFIANVTEIDTASGPRPELAASSLTVQAAELATRKRRPWASARNIVVTAVVVVAVALAAIWLRRGAPRASTGIRSIAVLPWDSLSGDASQDYFADGMTDELITELGQISSLRVISRTSVMRYKHAHESLPQIARELKVDAIVEGTILRSGDRVRITAQLIEASADRHLWAENYEGDLRDTLALQNKVARTVAEKIRINLTPREKTVLTNAPVVNPGAYEAYLKGRYFWNKRTAESLGKAKEYFADATTKDPTYARAYSGLADTYALLGDWEYAAMPAREALPKAKAAAMKALELDNALGEAHISLAFLSDGFDWDWDSADREFRRGIELNPSYATGHHWYAWHLILRGRNTEAITEMRKAQNLDPLSLIINADLAELLLIAHSYDESIQQSRKTIDMEPGFALAHNQLAQAYLQKQIIDPAIAELQQAIQLSGGSVACTANLARAYAAAGRRTEAERLLRDLKKHSTAVHSNAAEISIIYAALGDKDKAMTWLEKSYDERFNPGLLLRPGFDPLRQDPRFRDLLRRVGLTTP